MGDFKPHVLKLLAAAVVASACCAAQAGNAQDEAFTGALADGVTTAVGLAAGAAELNPLGPVLAIGMKLAVWQYAKRLPDTEQPGAYAAAAAWWQGAAANNLCLVASIASGGSFAPACVVIGVAWGMKTWQDSEPEREFWQGCAMLRQYAGEPGLACVYRAPAGEPVDTAAVAHLAELQVP